MHRLNRDRDKKKMTIEAKISAKLLLHHKSYSHMAIKSTLATYLRIAKALVTKTVSFSYSMAFTTIFKDFFPRKTSKKRPKLSASESRAKLNLNIILYLIEKVDFSGRVSHPN